MKYPRMRSGALLLVTSITSSHVFANGVGLIDQSSSGAGTAYAGGASAAKDATTVYGNPAGMSKLNRTEINTGVSMLHLRIDINDVQTSADRGTNDGDEQGFRWKFLPSAYLVTPLNDRWHLGLGLYTPSAVVTDYEDSFMGAGQGLYSSLKIVTVQPTVSYKISDNFSVGAGITFNRMTSTLTENLETHKFPQFLGGPFPDTHINTHGDDDAWGYNLGALWDITDKTRVGLTYHSKTDFNLDGRTYISQFPNFGLGLGPIKVGVPLGDIANGKYDEKQTFKMPDKAELSLTQELTDRLTLYAGATWTHWSRWTRITIHNQAMNPIVGYYLKDIGEDFNYRNTWSEAIGLSYQLTPQWELRSGFSFDPAPSSNSLRGVRIPTGNRKVYALGVGYSPNQDWSFDTTVQFFQESPHTINTPSRTDLGTELQPQYRARYKNTAYTLNVGVTHRF